jgi:enoyl-CoA hydratase
MADIETRIDGRAGRITLTRPAALNALTHQMCLAIEAALDAWADDDRVALILIEGHGDRAFCAGGDIAAMYRHGMAGDYAPARAFWRDEYRMNAKLFEFPKPVVSLMHGFTMGGGVGIGCHASHRIVGDTSRIAMPECGIGLVPDVGGSLLLAGAPGRVGEYLGVTGTRMAAGDAIHAGFADYYIPEAGWPALTDTLCATGDPGAVDAAAQPAPTGTLPALRPDIDRHFGGETIGDIRRSLIHDTGDFATKTLAVIAANAPLSMACTVEMIHRLRGCHDIRRALELEFRFTYRSLEHADLIEGVRARIIRKDNAPRWRHADVDAVTPVEVSRMLMPLGAEALTFQEGRP